MKNFPSINKNSILNINNLLFVPKLSTQKFLNFNHIF